MANRPVYTGLLYKPFQALRTVFWTLLALFYLAIVSPVMADNPVFTVEGVQVDVTASNALEAKSKAFEQAQADAFEIMAGRMLPEAQAQQFQMPELSTISLFIQDFEVTKEQLSSVRYLGTYTFRFKDEAVRRYFAGQGFEYSDVGSQPVLILPFYQEDDQSILWSRENPWMSAWNNSGGFNGLVPVVLPLGDLEDVQDVGDNEALSYREDRLNRMLARYNAKEAVLAIAVPDSQAGALNIHLYRTDRAGPELVQELSVPATGQSLQSVLAQGVGKVYQALQTDWKSRTMVSAAQNNRLQVQVNFKNLGEWTDTQRALQRVYGINDIVLKSLTPKSALVDLLFQGSESRLRLALEQANMTLTAPQVDMASLRDSQNRLKPLVYQLYLNRYAPAQQGSFSQRF